MAHHNYIKPGGNWSNGDSFSEAEIEQLEANLFKSINGDDGGTWAPAAPVVIGGGAVGGMTITLSGGATPNHPTYGATASMQRASMLMPRALVAGGGIDSEFYIEGQGMGSAARVMIFPPHGATLTNVRITFAVAGGHGGLPANQLGLSVYQSTLSSGALAALNSATIVRATAGGVAAYEALTSLDHACDQNNVIDRTLYSYGLLLIDESGVNAQGGNIFQNLRLDFTATKLERS